MMTTPNMSAQCEALLNMLHHAPLLPQTYRVLWTPNGGPSGTKKLSYWVDGSAPLRAPADWQHRKNIYFGVNPSAERRADWESSTNDTIGAVNAFLAEFDGKDFVQEAEWLPLYVAPDLDQVAVDARVELQELGLSDTRMEQRIAGKQRGALQRAQTAAIDAAYKLHPDEYKARALAHINGLAQRPTALWDSGGGYQGVWIFNETVYLYHPDGTRDLNAFERMTMLQRKWTAYVGGDRAASDLRRILRLFGSINFKPKYAPNYPTVEFIYCDLERTYDLDTLVALLPAETPRVAQRKVFVPTGAPVSLGDMGDVPVLPRHPAIDELNRTTDLRELMLAYGYTAATGNRLSRPGADTAGVELHSDNTATIYSSADPLYCERRIRPADVIVMYDHGGDVDAFLATMPAAQSFQDSIRSLRLFVERKSFAPFIPEGLVCERAYLTDSTDTKVASALIDMAVIAGTLTFETGLTTLKRLAGVGSRSTVTNTLKRLNGWFVTITPGDAKKAATYTLNMDIVSTLDTPPKDDDAHGLDSTHKGTVYLSNLSTTYSREKAKDEWQSGCTRRLRKMAKAATEGVQSTHNAKKSPAALWLDEHVAKGLGETLLRVVATLETMGDANRKELAAATGKAPSSIASATRLGEELGILEAEREHARAAAVYSLADNYMELVAELAPSLRTYGLSHERGERDAEEDQRYLERTLDAHESGKITLSADQTKETLRRLARTKNRRFKHLKWLFPELTSAEINEIIDAPAIKTDMRRRSILVAKDEQVRAEHRQQVQATARTEERQRLVEEVEQMRGEGMERKQIRRYLLQAGWTEDDLRYVGLDQPRRADDDLVDENDYKLYSQAQESREGHGWWLHKSKREILRGVQRIAVAA